MQALEPYAYWAFVSYAHEDRRSAERLQRELESYRLPKALIGKHSPFGPIPRRLFPVFRDRDELSSGPSLGDKLESALRVSRTLIVVCSPASFASVWVGREIEYFARIGRASRIFALLVRGNPGDAFAPAMLAACGGEPLAADARAGTRSARRDALVRLVAGIFDLSYDDLVRRDAKRERLRRRLRAAALGAAAVTSTAAYIGLADARYAVPAASIVREQLDGRDLSVFRRVPSEPELAASMLETESSLLQRLDEAAIQTRYLFDSPRSRVHVRDQWTSSQAVAGTFAGGFATPDEIARGVRTLDLGFGPGAIAMRGGRPYGWLDDVSDSTARTPYTSTERVAWTILALTEALHTAALAPNVRVRLSHERDVALAILGRSGQYANGAWSERPDLVKPNFSTYVSDVVYMALLASREAGLPWNGSIAARERALAGVRRFFLATLGRGSAGTWVTDSGWGYLDSHFEGLDLQVLATLLRDERDGGTTLPPAIVAIARRMAPAYEFERYSTDADSSTTLDTFANGDGTTTTQSDIVTFLRYPWSVAFAAEWYARERRDPTTTHARIVEARRILARVAVDDAPALLDDTANSTAWWAIGESAYAFGVGVRAFAPVGESTRAGR